MTDIKVLHINSYYKDALYRNLVASLERRGVESTTYYFARYGTDSQRRKDSGVIYSECYGQIDRFLFLRKEKKALNALKAMGVNASDFNVLHAHSLFANGYIAMQLAEETNVPYVVAVRNTDVNIFFRYRRNLRRIGYSILRNAAVVVFISDAYRNEVIDNILPQRLRSAIRDKSLVIPNGIDNVFLNNMPARHNMPCAGKIRVLQVGNINTNKGQTTTMKACELLAGKGIEVSLTVIGKTQSRHVASILSQKDFVVVVPFMSQSELIQQYRDADVFVMPSKHETFGLSYVEAMSQGLPVLYSKGQGFDGRYPDGAVGFSVNSRDAKDIANCIEQVLGNYTDISQHCLRSAKEYSWEAIAGMYVDLYRKVVHRHIAAHCAEQRRS